MQSHFYRWLPSMIFLSGCYSGLPVMEVYVIHRFTSSQGTPAAVSNCHIHTLICSPQNACLALIWSIEIWSTCPIPLSASFVLSQSIYTSLFSLERFWRESLHVHCLRRCTKALVPKKGCNNDGGCQMNHAFSGYSLHAYKFGLQPNST